MYLPHVCTVITRICGVINVQPYHGMQCIVFLWLKFFIFFSYKMCLNEYAYCTMWWLYVTRVSSYMGLYARKPVFGGQFTSNTGADQPAHPRSLISAFVIRFFESIVRNLATGEISFLASLCSWGDWFLSCLVRNPEDRVSRDEAQL